MRLGPRAGTRRDGRDGHRHRSALAWLSTLLGGGLAGADARSCRTCWHPLVGSVALLAGVAMSLQGEAIWSWRGWHVQAVGVAILALTWILAAS